MRPRHSGGIVAAVSGPRLALNLGLRAREECVANRFSFQQHGLPFRGSAAPSPAAAGFRLTGSALAVAAATLAAPVALAQPTGAQVIHGQASFARSGSNLTVTTQNGTGSKHSAINWQSFSVPAGSITQFN